MTARSRYLPEPSMLQSMLERAGLGPLGASLPPLPPRRPAAPRETVASPPASTTQKAPAPVVPPTPSVARAEVSTYEELTLEPDGHFPGQEVEVPTLMSLTEQQLLTQAFSGLPSSAFMDQRLEAVLQWVMGNTGAFAAFVADIEGLPLVNRNSPETYMAAIGPLAEAQKRISTYVPSPPDSSASIELADANVLQIIWASTKVGLFGVGLVLPSPVEKSLSCAVRRLLRYAIEPETRGES